MVLDRHPHRRAIAPYLLGQTTMYDSMAFAQMAYEAYRKRAGQTMGLPGAAGLDWEETHPDIRECWIAATEALLGSERV